MGKVNNHDIVNELAIRHGLSRSEAAAIYDDFMELIRGYVANGHEVALNRFMVIRQVHRNERNARNPRTGERIVSPAKDVVKIYTRKKFHDLSDVKPLPLLEGKAAEELKSLYDKWINPKLSGELVGEDDE